MGALAGVGVLGGLGALAALVYLAAAYAFIFWIVLPAISVVARMFGFPG